MQDVAVAVAQDVAGKPAVQSQLARLEGGRQDGFHERLAGLEILAAHGHLAVVGQLQQRRNVHRQGRRAVAEGHAGHQRRVGVYHAGRDGGVVVLEALLEIAQRLVDLVEFHEHLGAAAPQHHHAGGAVAARERLDVFHELHRQVVLVLARLDVRAGQAAHVILVEHGLPRPHVLQFLPHRLQARRLDDTGVHGSVVGVVGEEVPAAEDEVFQAGQRHEILDQGAVVLGALAEANGPVLRQRADGPAHALLDQLDARDQGRAHGAEAGKQDAKLALRRRDCHLRLLHIRLSPSGFSGSRVWNSGKWALRFTWEAGKSLMRGELPGICNLRRGLPGAGSMRGNHGFHA